MLFSPSVNRNNLQTDIFFCLFCMSTHTSFQKCHRRSRQGTYPQCWLIHPRKEPDTGYRHRCRAPLTDAHASYKEDLTAGCSHLQWAKGCSGMGELWAGLILCPHAHLHDTSLCPIDISTTWKLLSQARGRVSFDRHVSCSIPDSYRQFANFTPFKYLKQAEMQVVKLGTCLFFFFPYSQMFAWIRNGQMCSCQQFYVTMCFLFLVHHSPGLIKWWHITWFSKALKNWTFLK